MSETQLEKTIGSNISRYRTELGLTQSQLAEKVGVSTAFISRVERGQKMMKVQTLYATAQALNVSCDALLREGGPETHLENIHRLLVDRPSGYLRGIEKLVMICMEEFEPKAELPSER